jgi:3D (Asp-Asp-Asp) domain-containing protein
MFHSLVSRGSEDSLNLDPKDVLENVVDYFHPTCEHGTHFQVQRISMSVFLPYRPTTANPIRLPCGLTVTRAASRRVFASLLLFAALMSASCALVQKAAHEEEKILIVTATAYNSVPKQGQGDPGVGAWGDRIRPGVNAIAVSPDLLALGLKRGTKVRIQGLSAEYVVLDSMPRKWKRRIDIFMGHDVAAARSWGKREVTIYWRDIP